MDGWRIWKEGIMEGMEEGRMERRRKQGRGKEEMETPDK